MKAAMLKVLTLAGLAAVMLPADAKTVKYYHVDAVGSVRVVTDETGAVVERHDYLPFGEECATGACASNPGVGAGEPRKYTGKERDRETGLDYFVARYYAPRAGRFTAVDPVYTWRENLLDPQRWNRYAYGRNNPLRYVDPDGRVIDVIVDLGFIGYDLFDIGRSIARGEGVSGTQALALGSDIAAAVVPFATGAGVAIRAGSRFDDAIDLAKGADRLNDSSRAARREAMREQGIPTSQQPTGQVHTPGGRSYEYEVAGPGGSRRTKVVTEHRIDPKHGPHWEAGAAKPAGSNDSLGRRRHYNEDPATGQPKSRVGYKEN